MSYKHLLRLARNFSNGPAAVRPNALATKYYEEFDKFYPALVEKTIDRCVDNDYKPLKAYCKKMLEYFTLCKLPIQGEFLVYAYELLEEPGKLTDEKIHQAYVVACATEAIQCGWALADDSFDQCKTRAGKPAWHLLPDTSKMVVSDALLFRSIVDEMLRQNIPESIHPQISDIFNEMNLVTEMGQCLDFMMPTTKDFSRYTAENFQRITNLKAACYGLNSPVMLALLLCGKASEENFKLVVHMCNDLGTFTQTNNDYTEYRDYQGCADYRYNTDFVNGTCTWTAVKTLQLGTEEQKKIFTECYGSSDPEKIKRVIEIYDALDMTKLYKQEETNLYDSYAEKLRNLPANSTPSPEFFKKILEFYRSYISNTTKFYYKD
ncbi:uncharacterized protein [Battus philenor]|uniref:uncharacterized protein n=1 Tax=Battus philenor TaxID=42288 RepID=UPI0035CF70BC